MVGMADDLVVRCLLTRAERTHPASLFFCGSVKRVHPSSGSDMSEIRRTPNTKSIGEVFLMSSWGQNQLNLSV